MNNMQSAGNSTIPMELAEALGTFLSCVPATRISKHVRDLLLSHVYNETDTPDLDIQECILDIQALFFLLDTAEKAGY